MKRFVKMAAVCALCAGASVSWAQEAAPPSPEEQARQAAELRQSVFKLLGWNMNPLGGMLRNRIPFDASLAATSGARIEALALMIPDVFQADTRKFKVETEALPGIWDSQADFRDKAQALAKAAGALSAAAKTGDRAATLKAAAAVGQACGACHDAYRAD